MSANITYNSQTGQYEVMTRGAAWHHLGNVVQECQTWDQTIVKAGLDWSISKRQLDYNGDPIPAWGIFRDDLLLNGDPAKAFLTPSSETYELIQNRYMFAYLDTLLEGDGKAHYEAAGSLNGGTQVWALVNLKESFEVGASGDRFESYLVFTEDRTGKKAAACFITTVRVVCANTFESALRGMKEEQAVRFRHTKSIQEQMASAAGLFTGARQDIGMLQAKLERLAERKITKETFVEALDRIFPAKDQKQEESTRRQAKFRELISIFENNDDNMFPEIRGTVYNVFNAITEYEDHYSPVRSTAKRIGQTDAQIRSERAMFGTGVQTKQNALDVLLEVTASNPTRSIHREYSMPTNGSLLDAVLAKGVTPSNN
jgi:phage/plasmid-like protein (TIGR03299 family)